MSELEYTYRPGFIAEEAAPYFDERQLLYDLGQMPSVVRTQPGKPAPTLGQAEATCHRGRDP
jgi:hypothetical protein